MSSENAGEVKPEAKIETVAVYRDSAHALNNMASLAEKRLELAVLLAAKNGVEIVRYWGEDAPSMVGEENIHEGVLTDLEGCGLVYKREPENARAVYTAADDLAEFAAGLIEDIHRHCPAEAALWAAEFGLELSAMINDAGQDEPSGEELDDEGRPIEPPPVSHSSGDVIC
jgi:hypothetical protein